MTTTKQQPKWANYFDLKEGRNGYWILVNRETGREQAAGPRGYVLKTAEVLADAAEKDG